MWRQKAKKTKKETKRKENKLWKSQKKEKISGFRIRIRMDPH